MCSLHRKIAYITFQINNFATLQKCIDVFVTSIGYKPERETHSPKDNLTN
jgi:hypothetical protein